MLVYPLCGESMSLGRVSKWKKRACLATGGNLIAEGGHLGLGQGCELAGDLHVFFELRDVVATDDDGADGSERT